MTEMISQLYKSAQNNAEFKKAAFEADGDSPPKWYSNQNTKIAYAIIYYGWLVGKYGNDWRSRL